MTILESFGGNFPKYESGSINPGLLPYLIYCILFISTNNIPMISLKLGITFIFLPFFLEVTRAWTALPCVLSLRRVPRLDPKCVEMPYHKRHLEDEKWERPWKTNMVSEPTNGESKRWIMGTILYCLDWRHNIFQRG